MGQTPTTVQHTWQEIFEGGSAEAEQAAFLSLAQDMLKLQELNKERAASARAFRTLHAKIILGFTNARLAVNSDLPERFNVGHFKAGTSLPTTVRFSNASGVPRPDNNPDMRGVALRILTPLGLKPDLLLTNYPVSHARTARQFVDFARIASGDPATMLERLIDHFGQEEAARMLSNIKNGMRQCSSLALERYWSRGAVLWGPAGPVRFSIKPFNVEPLNVAEPFLGFDVLRDDLEARLRKADLTYHLAIQEFVDEAVTPIEDGAIEWMEDEAPSIDIATLVIPRQEIATDDRETSRVVDGMAFNPWNAPDAFRPLGNLMRARRVVYAASAAGWLER
jgi:hypothetical protein